MAGAQRERAETYFIIAAILILGYLTLLMFRPFLEWVILGFLFSYLFYKPFLGAQALFHRRGPAAGFVLVLILLLVFLPFVVILTFLFRDVTSFADALRQTDLQAVVVGTLESLARAFGVTTEPTALEAAAQTVSDAVQQRATDFFADFAAGLFAVIARTLVGLFLFGFTVYYGFVDGPRLVDGILSVIPLHRPEKLQLLQELRTVTNAVFVGHLLVSVIQASVGTLGFLILGVPRSIFWGFVMLLAAIIPVVGPFIVWVPVGLYLLFTDGPVQSILGTDRRFAALGVLLVVGPLVSTIDNIIRPKLVGSRASIHPFLVLVGALGGLFVVGFTGFVVGPLVLALFVAVLRVYRTHWAQEGSQHEAIVKGRQPPTALVPRTGARRRKPAAARR